MTTGAEIGDEVEIYIDQTNYAGGRAFAPSGETFIGLGTIVTFEGGCTFRKVASTAWGYVKGSA